MESEIANCISNVLTWSRTINQQLPFHPGSSSKVYSIVSRIPPGTISAWSNPDRKRCGGAAVFPVANTYTAGNLKHFNGRVSKDIHLGFATFIRSRCRTRINIPENIAVHIADSIPGKNEQRKGKHVNWKHCKYLATLIINCCSNWCDEQFIKCAIQSTAAIIKLRLQRIPLYANENVAHLKNDVVKRLVQKLVDAHMSSRNSQQVNKSCYGCNIILTKSHFKLRHLFITYCQVLPNKAQYNLNTEAKCKTLLLAYYDFFLWETSNPFQSREKWRVMISTVFFSGYITS